MKGCGPKHFCFSALRARSSTLAAGKRNRLPPRKMTAQRSWLFPLITAICCENLIPSTIYTD